MEPDQPMTDPEDSLQRIEVSLTLGDQPLEIELTVPAGPASPRVVLPLFQFLTNTVVDLAEKAVVSKGKSVSCKAGCGACCRQLVPISQTESRHLADLIESFSEPSKTMIHARFATARQKLAETGLLAELENPAPPADLNALGLRYFSLGIACPFLEAESCSIHLDRPLACREYLVTSPAGRCSHPSPDGIERVELPGHLSRALLNFSTIAAADSTLKKWVPLILSPQWAAEHPEPPPEKSGAELVDEALAKISAE